MEGAVATGHLWAAGAGWWWMRGVDRKLTIGVLLEMKFAFS